MICPFIYGTEIEYKFLGTSSQDKKNPELYIQVGTKAAYPDCYGDECPYHSYGNGYNGEICKRVEVELGE